MREYEVTVVETITRLRTKRFRARTDDEAWLAAQVELGTIGGELVTEYDWLESDLQDDNVEHVVEEVVEKFHDKDDCDETCSSCSKCYIATGETVCRKTCPHKEEE